MQDPHHLHRHRIFPTCPTLSRPLPCFLSNPCFLSSPDICRHIRTRKYSRVSKTNSTSIISSLRRKCHATTHPSSNTTIRNSMRNSPAPQPSRSSAQTHSPFPGISSIMSKYISGTQGSVLLCMLRVNHNATTMTPPIVIRDTEVSPTFLLWRL